MPSIDRSVGLRPSLLAVLVAAALSGGGCTMCPDPFDYSGPVPNGSVTQNDFAARSNGTRPVRATPFPWPPIVESSGRRPTPADDVDTTVLVAAESPADGAGPSAETPVEATTATVGDRGTPSDESAAFAAGIAPPHGAWMTRDRSLPPPGNVTPPAERGPGQSAPETTGWRTAVRSITGR